MGTIIQSTALVVLACSWLAMSAPSPSPAPSTSVYDLIIIGSGMSGLAAAKRAKEQGVGNVLILEARNRIGGRTVTQPLSIPRPANAPGPAVVDLGAAWIHAASGSRGLNPMAVLANAAGTGYVTATEDGLSFNPQGNEDNSSWDTVYENMLNRWETYYQRYLDGELSNLRPKNSDSLATVYNSLLQSSSWTAQQRNALIQGLTTEIVLDYAADLNQLSGPYAQEDYDWGDGPEALPSRGFGALAAYLAMNQTCWLNHVVESINYTNPNLVTVSGRNVSRGSPGVRFLLLARGVINTMPLGYLQSRLAAGQPPLYVPALSTTQTNAIRSLGMGLLNKVILVWPNSTWWSDVLTTPWITIRNETNLGAFSEYYNLAATPAKLPVIICFLGGSFANRSESLSNATTVALALAPLQRVMRQNGNRVVPPPVQTIVTRWGSDPWTFGSYSYHKVGMAANARSVAFAAVGQSNLKRVGFAGEHTHVMYPSTAHGAYLSGIREAERIVPVIRSR